MPIFYIDLRTKSGEFIEDIDGQEFSSLTEARDAAAKFARELMSEAFWLGRALDDGNFEIADESGRIILTLPLQAALA